MKKKIKDLTLREIKQICHKYDCFYCPIVACPGHTYYLYCKNNNFDLEREIEIDESNND